MKKLVIAPHIDDEVLGCGGTLDNNTFVLHCGVEDRDYVSAEQRVEELNAVKKFAGFESRLLKYTVNKYKAIDLIPEFEKIINEVKPEKVFISHPSYNQDHRVVYEAALIALRQHDINFFVKKVLVSEQPQDIFWENNIKSCFKPNYFVQIDIDRKLRMYSLLNSQVRPFRSLEHVRALAVLRGGQSNLKFAEAFEILRWID